MKYLKQIYYEMLHQKMMTWVSITGTALAIFLVMVFYLVDRLGTVEVAPESNRGRILSGTFIDIAIEESGEASGGLSHRMANQLYHNLKGVERESYTSWNSDKKDISIKGGESFSISVKMVDNEFWNIYDFSFIDGKPFSKNDIDSRLNKIILTRSVARKIFGEEKVSGREILLGMIPFTVCGVVKDTNPLLATSYALAYIPYYPEKSGYSEIWDEWLGRTQVILLPKHGMDENLIRQEVKDRYKRLQIKGEKEGYTLTYRHQPYNIETISRGIYSGRDPEKEDPKKWMIYTLLILVPAINLSSMTRSRLRHRVSEIGVLRAFGASKSSILIQVLIENFIITIFGGILGLVLCFIFMVSFSHLFFSFGTNLDGYITPDLNMIFTWRAFLTALVLCCILNLISAFIPSWKASRISPADAIRKVK